jgi:PHP family Zn ribbon phosphoesterase
MSQTATPKTITPEEHEPISKEDLGTLMLEELITRKTALEYARVAIEKYGLGSTELDLLGITTEDQIARIYKEVESAMEQLRSGKSGD